MSSADIEPNDEENTLIIRVHRMTCPAHDKAITGLFDELNLSNFQHPETGVRLICNGLSPFFIAQLIHFFYYQ